MHYFSSKVKTGLRVARVIVLSRMVDVIVSTSGSAAQPRKYWWEAQRVFAAERRSCDSKIGVSED